ncbi:MAG: gliding motility-associated-like protein [Candidatus Azotimanducaceae bacterium]|jgi:gliding motility-associated-like protein
MLKELPSSSTGKPKASCFQYLCYMLEAPFKSYLLILLLFNSLMSLKSSAQVTPNEQDCLGAIVLCQNLYNQPNAYSGEGNYPNEIPNTTCLGSGEENNVWYTFTAQSNGMLCFTITPYNATDDYDWAVFSLENYYCEDLEDHAEDMILACNFDATTGPTGANGNTGPQNEACIPVKLGVAYVINVSNFSATQFGYVLDFTASTAQLFDNIPPRIGLITNIPLKCGNDTISFITSELVKCKTIEKEDFTIIGGGGPYTVTDLIKPYCEFLEDKDSRYKLIISPPLQANGTYMFILNGNSGYIEDQCGNLASKDTLYFDVDPLELSLNSKRPSCVDSKDGYAIVTVESNPSGTFNFVWKDNTNTIIESYIGKSSPNTLFGLGQGLYTVEVGLCGTGVLFISSPPAINDSPVIQSDQCTSGSGFIDPRPYGGTPPYSYNWSNGTTTQRNNNLVAGDYSVIITDNVGCTFEETYTVLNMFQPTAEAGSNAVICGFNYQLMAIPSQGVGTWTDNSTGGVTYLGSINNPNVTVKVNQEDAITFYWKEIDNGCEDLDSVRIVFKALPFAYAGPNFVSCKLNYYMLGVTSIGSGLWSSPNLGVTFTDNTDPNTLVTVNTTGSYEFIWRELNKGCVDRDTIIGEFYDYPIPSAGNDDKVIGKNYQLNGSTNPLANSVEWTSNCFIDYNPSNISSNPIITSEYGCCEFYYAYHFDECSNTDTVQICFVEQPTTYAGIDDSVCGNTYILNPTLSVGQTQWTSFPSGVLFEPNNSSGYPLITVSSPGIYTFVLTETNDIASDTDTVKIRFFDYPIANAGKDTAVCQSSFMLNANSPADSGWWSGPSHVSFNPNKYIDSAIAISTEYGTDTLVWSNSSKDCISTDTIVIQFIENPVADAGLNDSICGDSINIKANPSRGNGLWTNNYGLIFSEKNLDATQVALANNPYGKYDIIWKEQNLKCFDFDTVNIQFIEIPNPIVAPDKSVCGYTAEISVINNVGIGFWQTLDSSIIITDSNSTTTSVDVSAIGYGTYTFYWFVTNNNCNVLDSLQVTFNQDPNPYAGKDDTICDSLYHLNAIPSIGIGTWSTTSGSFSNPNDSKSIFYANYFGQHLLIWSEVNENCSDSDTVYITLHKSVNANAGLDTSFCGLSGMLDASISSGQGIWTSFNDSITLLDSSKVNSFISANNVGYGTYGFEWKETNGSCNGTDTVYITFIEIPDPHAGIDDSICGNQFLLNANPSIGDGKWTLIEGNTTYSPSDSVPSTTVTVTTFGTHNFIWKETNQLCSKSDTVTIKFFQAPISDAGKDDSICGLTIQLQAQPSTGISYWTGSDSITFADSTKSNTQVTVNNYGETLFIWKEVNGQCLDQDSVKIFFYESPIAKFSVLDSNLTTLNLNISLTNLSQLGSFYYWDFGDNTSSNVFEPNHYYSSIGLFDITLTVNDNFGCMDTYTIQIKVEEDSRVFMPNAFSPNNDGLNETIAPSILGVRKTNYVFTIFDRWGKLVYQDYNPSNSWDGSLPGNQGYAVQGVYPYIIQYESYSDKIHQLKGSINLIK